MTNLDSEKLVSYQNWLCEVVEEYRVGKTTKDEYLLLHDFIVFQMDAIKNAGV